MRQNSRIKSWAGLLSKFASAERGSIVTVFALSLPVLLGAGGISLDYARAAYMKSKLQSTADSAALMSARELQLASSTAEKISALAKSYVGGMLKDVAVTTNVDTTALTVQVILENDVFPTVGASFLPAKVHVKAAATAKLTSGLPLCLIALEPKAAEAIALEKDALLTAPSCLVYSNSTSSKGISSQGNAVLKAGYICSAGGKINTKNANFAPQPATDCPVIPDPLAGRKAPTDTACSYTSKVIDGGVATLSPGVYCGGLIITNGAQVTFSPGIFTIKDGPLSVDNNATLKGEYVALFLTGVGSNLTFAAATTISLTAPKDGPLVGILIYDDPTGAPAPVTPKSYKSYAKGGASPREHLILSDNARTLLGTIYMPRGRLIIDATKAVADQSAYTVLVLQQLDLYSGPNLVLNSDYGASDIPVPAGVGNFGGKVVLAN
jgi:Flp pilus assembly protein TadG